MPKIIIKHKAEIVQEYIIGKENISVGRSESNNIVLSDEAVSEDHCLIKYSGGQLHVEDLNTAFGTRVNGELIRTVQIKINDEINLGKHSLVIKPSGDEGSGEERGSYFLGIQGKMEGRKFELNTGETRIGRSEEFNDIWIPKELDKSVSRRHATIRFKDGKYILADKRSRNRTFINQRQVNETDEIVLEKGDEILIGKSIFRFISGSKDDYSPPKKAGVFLVRLLLKLKKIAALVLIGIGFILILKGVGGLSTIGAKPDTVSLNNFKWSLKGLPSVREDPALYDIVSSPAIGDINNDGKTEIVVARGGYVYAFSGRNGELLWDKKLGQQYLTSVVLADINGDKILDVVVGSDDSRVYALEGVTGGLLYKSSFIGGRILPASSPLVADMDGDGFNDIVVVTDDRIVCFLYSPAIGKREPFYFSTPDDIMSSAVLLESGIGLNKVAVATNGGKIYLFESANPDNREVVDVTQKINMLKGVNLILNEISSIPAVSDLDGDGIDDLIFAAGSYYVAALSGRTLSLLWAYKIEPFSTLKEPERYSSPVISDFNGDNIPDVAIAWANGKIIALNGRTGKVLWEYNTDDTNRIISSLALADFNKDTIMDVVAAGEDGKILILDGSPDAEERLLAEREVTKNKISSTPVVGDIDADGYIDIVVSCVKEVHLFTTPSKVFNGEIFWGSFRKDAKNSVELFYVSKSSAYQSYAGVGVIMILGVLLLGKREKKKKFAKRPIVINGSK